MEIRELYTLFTKSTGISTDTRKISEGNIFVALKGPNFNGNAYATQALEKGAGYVVIDEAEFAKDERYILVDDGLKTLQKLSNYHRKQLNIPFIGITGSNGKTTTKELTFAVLSKKYKTFATKGNLNNHIGVPLTLLSISKEIEIAIIELGANHIGELAELCEICEPTHGLITNIGLDHLEGYGSLEGVAQGNSELYYFLLKNNGKIFVNSQDEMLMRMSNRFSERILYGKQGDSIHSEIISNNFFLKVKTENNIEIQTQLIGDYNLDNINVALVIGKHFGISIQDSAKAIEAYSPSNNRSQLLKKGTNSIILDCYNANPSSMIKSLESFKKIEAQKKVVMIGDMFELGEHSQKEHRNIIELVNSLKFDAAYFCGNEFLSNKQEVKGLYFFPNRESLAENLKATGLTNSAILIKGSRGMVMEKLLEVL